MRAAVLADFVALSSGEMYRQVTRAVSGLVGSGLAARRELVRQAPGWCRHFRAPVRKATPAPVKLLRTDFAVRTFARHTQPAGNKLQQARELGVQLPDLCPGCGVLLQTDSPDAPG